MFIAEKPEGYGISVIIEKKVPCKTTLPMMYD